MTSQAWYRDDKEGELDQPHYTEPPQFLSPQQVLDKTGVRMIKVEDCEDETRQAKLRAEGGYNYYDWLEISRDTLPNYDEKMKTFYAEHLHKDEEIRLIIAGGGYFEIRDYEDRWIRLHLQKGDLLNLPAGIYHRFTLDTMKYIKMLRLFSEVPKWEAVNRPEADNHPAHQDYISTVPVITAAE